MAAGYYGDIALGQTIDVKFTTVSTTGAPTTLAGTPVISAYVGNSTTELTAGITLSVDFDSRTGMHNVRVVASSGNGYAAQTDVELVITTGTVGGTSVVGYVVGAFSIENRSAIRPTTAGRTLDVSAGGEAGLDWANVGSPTTTVGLSGTTVKTATDVATDTGAIKAKTDFLPSATAGATGGLFIAGTNAATTITTALTTTFTGNLTGSVDSVTGAVGSVTGNVGGNVTGSVGSVVGNVGGNVVGDVQGNVDGSVASVAGAVGSVTGNVGGNVIGSVASVVGNVGGDLVGDVQGNVDGSLGAMSAAALADFFTVDSGETYASAVVGSVVKEIADNATVIGTPDVNVVQISGDAPAADALESILDGGGGTLTANITGNLSGSVGSVTGAVGSVTGSVGGNVVGTVASVVGNVGGNVVGTVASVVGNVGGNVTGSIGSLAAQAKADVNAEVVDVMSVDTFAEPTGVPAATTTLADKIGRQYMALRNEVTVDSNTGKKQFHDDAGNVEWEKDFTDVGNVYNESESNAP